MEVPRCGTPGLRAGGPSWHPRTVEELGQESSFKGSPSLDPPGSAGRSPRSPPPPRAAACMASVSGESRLPAAFQPCPGPHSPGKQAAGAAPARRARARAPHVSCCPDRRRELGGLRGSELPGCTELRAGSADCSALCCPGLLPSALLSRARAAGSAGGSQLPTARFLPLRQALSPLARTSPAELRLIINPQALCRCKTSRPPPAPLYWVVPISTPRAPPSGLPRPLERPTSGIQPHPLPRLLGSKPTPLFCSCGSEPHLPPLSTGE